MVKARTRLRQPHASADTNEARWDVFLSYSRRDKEFVRKLDALLKQARCDAWVDWNDIPVGTQWPQRISQGIERSDIFIFILSPNSMASEYCNKELGYARELNKRILPVLLEEVKPLQLKSALTGQKWREAALANWDEIQTIQRFDFSDSDPSTEEFNKLVKVINQDPEYIEKHTDLLVEARAWASKNNDTSLLLRGSKLKEAETWLVEMAGKKPPPATLHHKYIAASRRLATHRQRQLLSGVVSALGITFALLVLSIFLYGRAEDQRKKAVYQSNIARSAALSAQAQLELQGAYPERGVLLAYEALENYPYTWQAEQALGQAIQTDPLRLILPKHRTAITDTAWSPDDAQIATAEEYGLIHIWNARDGSEFLELDARLYTQKTDPSDTSGNEVLEVAWSPDGTRLAVAGYRQVSIWDAQTGEEIDTLGDHEGLVMDVKWSPDGERILTTGADGKAIIHDVATGAVLVSFEQHTHIVYGADWSPDGSQIITASADGTAIIWDSTTGDTLHTLAGHSTAIWESLATLESYRRVEEKVGDDWQVVSYAHGRFPLQGVTDAVWSPLGDLVATSGVDGHIKLWDAATGEELTILQGHTHVVSELDWSPDGAYLASSSYDNTIRVWSPATGEQVWDFQGATGWVHTINWSPDGTYLVMGTEDNQVKVLDFTTGKPSLILTGYHEGAIRSITWSPWGNRLVTASDDNTAIIWNSETGVPVFQLAGHEGPITDVEWSAASNVIALSSEDGYISTWDPVTGQVGLVFPGGEILSTVSSLAWSPDGFYLLTSPALSGQIIEAFTGYIAQSLHDLRITRVSEWGYSWQTYGTSWSPDGIWLAIGTDRLAATIWNLETGEQHYLSETTSIFADETANVHGTAWSPDSQRIATANIDGRVQVWDVRSRELVFTFTGHANYAGSIAWSPNGAKIAVGTTDGMVQIWDAYTGQNQLTFTAHPAQINAVAWSPDSTQLATASEDGTAAVWSLWGTRQELLELTQTCCLVRNLTPEERQLFNLPVE